jgi:sulfate transport system permease protein
VTSADRRVLPGFRPAITLTVAYVSLLICIPLATLVLKSASLGPAAFWSAVTSPRALSAYRLSIVTALAGASINAVFGSIVAWVLVRYEFPGKRIVDALVDLPFALPTAVAGIALTSLYSENGWIGSHFAARGIKIAYTPLGIIVALTFIGLPFVVRTVQPVLEDLEPEIEDAAAVLGAARMATLARVVLPGVVPALATGFALAFARGLGEYGSVVFIAGNMPMVSEITPLLIMIKLEQYDYAGATAIALVFLVVSFTMLLAVNALARKSAARLRMR